MPKAKGLTPWAAAALALVGCASTPPTTFYLLDPGEREVQAEGLEHGLALGVGPIELPKHLDRNQIVTRETENRLGLSEGAQWAEPLKEGVTRVVMINLALALDTNRVYALPQRQNRPMDMRVDVDIARFDGTLGGEVVLGARWNLSSGNGRELLHTQVSRIREPVNGLDFDAFVAAQSRALVRLSGEIAAAVRERAAQAS